MMVMEGFFHNNIQIVRNGVLTAIRLRIHSEAIVWKEERDDIVYYLESYNINAVGGRTIHDNYQLEVESNGEWFRFIGFTAQDVNRLSSFFSETTVRDHKWGGIRLHDHVHDRDWTETPSDILSRIIRHLSSVYDILRFASAFPSWFEALSDELEQLFVAVLVSYFPENKITLFWDEEKLDLTVDFPRPNQAVIGAGKQYLVFQIFQECSDSCRFILFDPLSTIEKELPSYSSFCRDELLDGNNEVFIVKKIVVGSLISGEVVVIPTFHGKARLAFATDSDLVWSTIFVPLAGYVDMIYTSDQKLIAVTSENTIIICSPLECVYSIQIIEGLYDYIFSDAKFYIAEICPNYCVIVHRKFEGGFTDYFDVLNISEEGDRMEYVADIQGTSVYVGGVSTSTSVTVGAHKNMIYYCDDHPQGSYSPQRMVGEDIYDIGQFSMENIDDTFSWFHEVNFPPSNPPTWLLLRAKDVLKFGAFPM